MNIFVLNETITNGFRSEFLDIFSLIDIFSAILVIISKNPIVSVLFLICLFLSIATYLIMLGLNFVGLSYLLVYIGAVSILFLFILMLINVRVSELLSNTSNSLTLAIIITIILYYTISQVLPYGSALLGYIFLYTFKVFSFSWTSELPNDLIYFSTSKSWDGNLSDASHITSIGNIMYTSYSIWLILTAIILLLAMVGSIVITIKQKIN